QAATVGVDTPPCRNALSRQTSCPPCNFPEGADVLSVAICAVFSQCPVSASGSVANSKLSFSIWTSKESGLFNVVERAALCDQWWRNSGIHFSEVDVSIEGDTIDGSCQARSRWQIAAGLHKHQENAKLLIGGRDLQAAQSVSRGGAAIRSI